MNNTRRPHTCFSLVLLMACVALLGQAAALADWDPGDGFKMHYPQLPLQGGLDVEFAASYLADDWQCTESGPVTDVHLWISWMQNLVQDIGSIRMEVYSDIPADQSGLGYSIPGGVPLWSREMFPNDFTVREMAPDLQGWYDPSSGEWGLQDHDIWQQINIAPISDPFIQEAGNIYWLALSFQNAAGQGLPYVGWKESADHFNDDAVWLDTSEPVWVWRELTHPEQGYSLDLAFVITTPEPTTVLMLLSLLGCIAWMRRRD